MWFIDLIEAALLIWRVGMDLEQILQAMTPEVYQRLMTAVEIGKWPDGTVLTPE